AKSRSAGAYSEWFVDAPDRQQSHRRRRRNSEKQALPDPRPRSVVYGRIPEHACRDSSEVREVTPPVAETERICREIRADYQGILSGTDDLVWRGVVAVSHSELRGPLSHRTQSPGSVQPANQPRARSHGKRGVCPTAPATGQHAELLLPHRCL